MEAPVAVANLPSWLLSQSAAHAHRLLTESLGELGARGYHYRVLAALEEQGPMSQAMLGRRSGIHLSDLVAALNELADGGYVQRSPDAEDKRRNVVSITPKGRTHARRLTRQVAKAQDDLLAPLTPAERTHLVHLLTRLLAHEGH